MNHVKFGIWFVFGMTWLGVVFTTIFVTGAMTIVGLWDPRIPALWKWLTPLGYVLVWAEVVIACLVLEWCTS